VTVSTGPMSQAGSARPTGPIPFRSLPWGTRLVLVLLYIVGGAFCGGLLVVFGIGGYLVHPAVGVAYGVGWGVVVVLIVRQQRDRRRRRRVFAAWADEHGWDYRERSTVLVGRWTAWPFRGASRTATDVLSGAVDGCPVTSFTHGGSWWPRARGRSADGVHVVMTTLPTAFPSLTITPEDQYTRAAGAIGLRDIQLESAEFNARWRVLSSDPRFAHAVLQPRLMARLLEPDVEGMSMLVEDRDIALFAPGRTLPSDVEPRAALLAELVRIVPRYLPDDHPTRVRTRRDRRS